MRICVAQTKSIQGDIVRNVAEHKKAIEAASTDGTDLIVFPELSITGYEPGLARELATARDDTRLDDFQRMANARNLIIGVGAPLKGPAGIHIGMIVFQPHRSRETYCKKH